MEPLMLYFGKVIVCSGVMFLYYRLFLKDKTFHHYNRFYLLSILVVSVLLPLLKVSYFTLEVSNNIYLLINKISNFKQSNTLSHDFIYFQLAACAVGLVSFYFVVKFLYGIISIRRLKNRYAKKTLQGINFYETDLQEAPFSFFRNLFWKNSIHMQSDLGRQILKHEMVHIEQKHTWDKIFVQVTTSVFWFNPFFYLITKEIHLVHEYLADKKSIKNSDTKAFAQMLLASHFSGKQFPAASPFLSSNLKRRLTMLKKSKTKFGYARKIFALPLLFALTFIYLVNAKNKEIRETNLVINRMVAALKKDTILPKSGAEKAVNAPVKTDETTGINGKSEQQSAAITTKMDTPVQQTENLSSLDDLRNAVQAKRQEIDPIRSSLQLKEDEGRKLSDELRQKGDEYRKLSEKKDFDNPRMKVLGDQMNDLGKKIDGIFSSEEYQKKIKLMESKYAEMDVLFGKMDQLYAKRDAEYLQKNTANNDQWINMNHTDALAKKAEQQAKEVEKMVNSNAFKIQIVNARKAGKDAEKMVNSKAFKRQIEQAEKAAKDAEKMLNSKEVKQQLEQAEKAAQDAAKMEKAKVLILNTGSKVSSDDVPLIYIDGNQVTEAEMRKFPQDKIEKVMINKKGYNGNTQSEIRIYTKK